jgi:acetyl-CoA carboxylase carboxyl transferase subunit beta
VAWTRFGKKRDMPGGLWLKCESCGQIVFRKEVESRRRVCPQCNFHFTLPSKERIEITLDPGSFEPCFEDIEPRDPLGFVDRVPYLEKIRQTQEKVGVKEAAVIGTGAIRGIPVVFGVLEFGFLGGSMGEVVGEKIARGVELALERRFPFVVFTSSGGARMHEGAISLMQMAKTCGALSRLARSGGFSISVLTHPTTGGVTASFASTTDVVLAEPGALIGFAGPRVIQETIRQDLPKGFQRAEFLLEKGQIDGIVTRERMRVDLARLLAYATGIEPSQRAILFLCTGNSCRSQMAEGFARSWAKEGTRIWSAGTHPVALNPRAVSAMHEAGVDIGGHRPKGVDEIPQDEVDTVVTLCGEAEEACPTFPRPVRRIHWPIPDPAKAKGSDDDVAAFFRKIRDQIGEKVRALLEEDTA